LQKIANKKTLKSPQSNGEKKKRGARTKEPASKQQPKQGGSQGRKGTTEPNPPPVSFKRIIKTLK
jgi:hypothetical protein